MGKMVLWEGQVYFGNVEFEVVMGYPCGHDEDAVRYLRLDFERTRRGGNTNESVCG